MNINPFHKSKPSKAVRETLAPREAFITKGKDRFLAAFDAHYGTRSAIPARHGMPVWARGLVTVGALAAIMVSVSAYADNANVPADSPLYPLKRLNESVQLALTPKNDQPTLEATFAVRRANEIQDLSVRKPTSTLINKLSIDFDNDVSSSLAGTVSPNNTTTSAPSFAAVRVGTPTSSTPSVIGVTTASTSTLDVCGKISSAVEGSVQAQINLLNNSSLLARFQTRCGGVSTTTITTSTVITPITLPGRIINPTNGSGGATTTAPKVPVRSVPPILHPMIPATTTIVHSTNVDIAP